MTTVTTALADAFALLRRDLYGFLDAAERHATKYEEWQSDDVKLAQALIPDLVTVIRGMLMTHKETSDASCRECGREWPCHIVNTVHALVKDPDNCFVELHRKWLEEDDE